jgi:hypothetical protein
VVKPCNLRRSLLFKEIVILTVPRSPCLQNTLLMAVQASSMAPAVPGRRVGASYCSGAQKGDHYIGTYGGPPMSPLRYPAKAKAQRSLVAVSIRLVQRYARARRRTRATVQKPFQRRGEVIIISGPTGGRRCLRYGALLKRGLGVRSSGSRSGSFVCLPRPGAARELPFKSHFKGEAKFLGRRSRDDNTDTHADSDPQITLF